MLTRNTFDDRQSGPSPVLLSILLFGGIGGGFWAYMATKAANDMEAEKIAYERIAEEERDTAFQLKIDLRELRKKVGDLEAQLRLIEEKPDNRGLCKNYKELDLKRAYGVIIILKDHMNDTYKAFVKPLDAAHEEVIAIESDVDLPTFFKLIDAPDGTVIIEMADPPDDSLNA